MAFVLADRVKETATSPGTGTVTLLGAVSQYQSFSAAIGANNTTYYVIADQSGNNWEVGYGTVGSGGTTLARTTVLASSNSGSLVNFSSGTQNVWCDYTATRAVIQDNTLTATASQLQASNGLILNNRTISASYSIPSVDSALSVLSSSGISWSVGSSSSAISSANLADNID